MKLGVRHLIVLVVLAAVGVWGWRAFHPSPEQVIRKRLGELAQSVSFGPSDAPLAKVWNSQGLGKFFTSDVQVTFDAPGAGGVINGRDQLLERAMGARSVLSSLKVEFPDITVALGADGQSAVVEVTAKAKASTDKEPYLQELKITFQKTGGDWLIRKVETVKTLSLFFVPEGHRETSPMLQHWGIVATHPSPEGTAETLHFSFYISRSDQPSLRDLDLSVSTPSLKKAGLVSFVPPGQKAVHFRTAFGVHALACLWSGEHPKGWTPNGGLGAS
jgi:hypothetical protein